MPRPLRWSSAMALQAGGRLLLQELGSSLAGRHPELTPAERVSYITISIMLVCFAGIMSGLTLGLCSMDLVELEVLKRSGTVREHMYSAAIVPILSNQHLLLVTLLLCNACAMEALPLFLDRLADPVTAILISVTAVLVFGEILPQAVCTRYGLAIGYYCSWFVRGLMLLTSPISWPISKLLDFMLGSDHRALFRRGQLKALVDIHGADEGLGGNLSEDEIKVICGALDLTNKTARKSMTALNKVFMLPADARLNMSTMRAILASGHSRIPVHTSGDRSSIIGLILVKELLQYKTHQEVPVSEVRMRSLPRLPADTPMYDMLKLFQTGRSHMVVLTDTPATARAAAAAAAAAAARAAEEAAASAEAASDSSKSSGGSPLASILSFKGKNRKRKQQFQSALLQPAEEQQQLLQPPPRESDAASIATTAGSGAASAAAWIAAAAAEEEQQGNGGVMELYPEQEMLGFGFAVQPPQHLLLSKQQQRQGVGDGSAFDVLGRDGQQQQHEQELATGSPFGSSADGLAGFSGSRRAAASSAQNTAAVVRSVQFSTELEVFGSPAPEVLRQQQQQDGSSQQQQQDPQHRRRDSSGSGSGVESGPEGERRSRKSKSGHSRSLSGPLPSVFQAAPLLPPGVEGAPEGVAVPIGIITIEDVIEELMQAEIVDETDLYLDNERTIAVNAAALAQSLPAQLRKALAPTLTRSPAGAGARAVTVRKLVKQRSASSLGLTAAAAAAAAGGAGPAAGIRMCASSEGGAPAAAGGSGAASGLAAGGSSAGVAASLAAAAAALAGSSASGAGVGSAGEATVRGRSSGEKQPLLGSGERSSAAS